MIIGGYGHIGLPMGIVLADAGLQVALYDIDKSKEPIISAGKLPFLEYDAEPILERVIGKNLHLARSIEEAANSDALVVTIGTPLDEYMNPKLMPMLSLAENLLPHLRDDHLLILRSTVFPGTSQQLQDFFVKKGVNLHLAFCPERIAQGYAIRELKKLPQIISGFTPQAVERSRRMFERLGQQIIEVPVMEAEMAKLFTNAYRYIQFSIANQFFMMASENGLDFNRIHHAMTHGYERGKDFPSAGFAAGPCLLKDTMQLSAFYQNNFMLGHSAMLINEGLPAFIVNQLRQQYDLKNEVVGILGMAFKADVDDIRDSLSYKVGKLLRFHGATVLYSDEFAEDPTFISKEDLVQQSSIVILGVPHSAYREMTFPDNVNLVDVWGTFETYDRC
jgi:UDP-N-acetyl-D-mannosaminuronic acid dehydrogenase